VPLVDPNKEIAKGYKANVMPLTHGTRLSAKQVDALTNYIYRSTNTKAKSQGKQPVGCANSVGLRNRPDLQRDRILRAR